MLCCGCCSGLNLLLSLAANGETIQDGRAQLKNDSGLVIPESADYVYGKCYELPYEEKSCYIFVVNEMPSELSAALSDFEVIDQDKVKCVRSNAEVDKSKYPNGYEPDWEQNYKYYHAVAEVEDTAHYLSVAYCVDNGSMYISLVIDYNMGR